MYGMMSTTGSNLGFIVLWSLHILSVVAFFTGLILLIVLAIKTFTSTQLKNWAICLMIVGSIVCLFTIAARGEPWVGGTSAMKMQTMGRMMEMMMDHDEGMSGPEHDEHEEMVEMMRGMMMR